MTAATDVTERSFVDPGVDDSISRSIVHMPRPVTDSAYTKQAFDRALSHPLQSSTPRGYKRTQPSNDESAIVVERSRGVRRAAT